MLSLIRGRWGKLPHYKRGGGNYLIIRGGGNYLIIRGGGNYLIIRGGG